MKVVGVDGFKHGWVAVALGNGAVASVEIADDAAALAGRFPDAVVIGIDIPIGLPDSAVRWADCEARGFVGARRSSVYTTPPRRVLAADTYTEARAIADASWVQGVSAQAYRLGPKILQVDAVAATDGRLVEVHPEVSFRWLAGRELAFNKKTWNGQMERRRLLEDAGVRLPDQLPDAGGVAPDDVLDAAVAAWSAHRVACGMAASFPDPPEIIDGRRVAIWC